MQPGLKRPTVKEHWTHFTWCVEVLIIIINNNNNINKKIIIIIMNDNCFVRSLSAFICVSSHGAPHKELSFYRRWILIRRRVSTKHSPRKRSLRYSLGGAWLVSFECFMTAATSFRHRLSAGSCGGEREPDGSEWEEPQRQLSGLLRQGVCCDWGAGLLTRWHVSSREIRSHSSSSRQPQVRRIRAARVWMKYIIIVIIMPPLRTHSCVCA